MKSKKEGLPEFAGMAGKIFDLARATYFTNGEIGTGNAEFSETDEMNIFCLNSAFREPCASSAAAGEILQGTMMETVLCSPQ